VDLKLEGIVLPVSDVDRAKAFYQGLGFRLDADVPGPDGFRIVQLTPPGSEASILFGSGVTSAAPGSVQNLLVAVADIDEAHDQLAARGAAVSDVYHDAGGVFFHAGTSHRVPGAHPTHASYSTFASFADPDGNGWVLQEITERLPGRTWAAKEPLQETETAQVVLTALKQAAEAHGVHEAEELGGEYDAEWPQWYSGHMARTLAKAGYTIVRTEG
jgi:catechol 2,3-dioxygenase-like lactoylglutathione lyase family enzyme